MTRIYTRTGDKGTTSLYNGTKRAKNDDIFHLLGKCDELNVHLGAVRVLFPASSRQFESTHNEIVLIQNRIFDLGAIIGSDFDTEICQIAPISLEDVKYLEECIDHYNELLPKISTFVLPGTNEQSIVCDKARVVCREFERYFRSFDFAMTNDSSFAYINRLSDYLFQLSRICNYEFRSQSKEVSWTKKTKK